MGFAFVGASFMTCVTPGFGLAAQAMEGQAEVKYFLTATLAFVMVAVINGHALRRNLRRYRKRQTGCLPEKKLWLVGLAVVSTALDTALLFPTETFLKEGRPLGIITLMLMSTNFWLAVFDARRHPWVAVIALIQLGGTAFSMGVLTRHWTVDGSVVNDPLVLIFAGTAFLNACSIKLFNAIAAKEEKLFGKSMRRPLDEADRRFTTSRIMFLYAFNHVAMNAGLFLVFACIQGLPHVRAGSAWVGSALLLALAAVGNRLSYLANSRGVPSRNGTAVAATLVLVFALNWLLQDVVPTWPQFVGAAVTVAGAVAVAFMRHDDARQTRRAPAVATPGQ